MLSLSQTTGYAVLALSCLEGPGGSPVRVREIADKTGVPKTYLSKVIQILSLKGLVNTKRGYKGGLVLARPPEEVSLYEVAEAIEGPGFIGECLLGIRDGCTRGCVTREFWQNERERIAEELRRQHLSDVSRCAASYSGLQGDDEGEARDFSPQLQRISASPPDGFEREA